MASTKVGGARNGGKRDERRALQHELGRNQILSAAEEVFAAKGFHDATIKEIAHLAEFSVGAVYSFFEKKDDLFVQIYLHRGEEFMIRMRSVLSDGDPVGQLHALARFEIDFMHQHPNFGRLYLRNSEFALGEVESQIHQAVSERYGEAMRLQEELFARGQAASVFRAGAPAVLARLFSGLIAAYQASDPKVMNGGGTSAMSVDELIDVVDGAFLSSS